MINPEIEELYHKIMQRMSIYFVIILLILGGMSLALKESFEGLIDDEIDDYEFIQELDQRYMENNPYVAGVNNCVNISSELHLIHSSLGISDFIIRSDNGSIGHRRLCLEYEPQSSELKGFNDRYPNDLEMIE